MAQDIDLVNSIFYQALIPPISGTSSYELSAEWGSRIAVHSGRAKGLAGMGTATNGTFIAFPSGYFQNIPIIEVSEYYSSSEFSGIQPFQNNPIFAHGIGNAQVADQIYPSSIGTNGFTLNCRNYRTISWTAKGV